ncbi:MAG: hypothetical protein AB7Q01_08405 [Gammaproteobacteria bacterium]
METTDQTPLQQALAAGSQSALPYDPVRMVRTVTQIGDGGSVMTVERRVVKTMDEALMNPEADYFHPGGVIYGRDGEAQGYAPGPNWFIKGHKWERDLDSFPKET